MSELTHFVRLYIQDEDFETLYLTNEDLTGEMYTNKKHAHLFTIDDWHNWASQTDIQKEELGQDELMRLNGQLGLFEASQ